MAKVKMKTEEVVTEEVKEVVEVENKKPVKEIKKAVVVGCNFLRLRKESNTSAEIVELLPVNSEVTVLNSINEEWSRVKSATGKNGFVMNKFIKNLV